MNCRRIKPGTVRRGFTLIELLVVIAIIGILAAMLLPVLHRGGVVARVNRAKLEINQLATAIRDYDSANNRFPVSNEAMAAAAARNGDFTYGTAKLTCVGGQYDRGFKSPSSAGAMPVFATGLDDIGDTLTYQTNNAEVMAILLDLENYGDGRPTINKGHAKNPQRTKFLNASMVPNTTSPGVGTDGVYRDPWGNPYIITLDLNSDERTCDSFYRSGKVSQKNGSVTGVNGLANTHHNPPDGKGDWWQTEGQVMVWSAGPDKMIDLFHPADQGANKDNVLSWKPN
jgi:prepilin-type N-terminal cleavage/methylation domain-containing protein